MNTPYFSFLIFLFVMVLPNSAYPTGYLIENRNDHSLRVEGGLVSQLGAESLRSAQSAAVEGLKIMVSQLMKAEGTIDEEHTKELGLETKDLFQLTNNTNEDQLTNVFRIFHVSLRDLRDFVPSKTAQNLLVDTHQLLFPIKINGKDKLSVTVRSVLHRENRPEHQAQMKEWRPTRWGLPNLTSQLTAEQKHINDKIPNSKNFRLVSIPSLNRNFLGYEDDTGIKLVPLVSDGLFKEGTPLSANEVFLRLVPEAKGVDDSPR